jgi:hypothetical protein
VFPVAMPLAVATLGLLAGCARPAERDEVTQRQACTAQTGPFAAGVSAAELAGPYHLTVVSTTGDSTGRRAEGRLTLEPNDSAHTTVVSMGVPNPNVTTPLFGWTDIVGGAVDAVNTGSLGATDPDAPGVLVLESRAAGADASPEIILRLGEYSNRRDQVLFDGGYTVLRVSWVDNGAFGGTWESAAMNYGSAGGYFCAYPAP